MTDGRLLEPTRPTGGRRGATSTDPRARRPAASSRRRGRPARGATPPSSVPRPRRRRRRINRARIVASLLCLALLASTAWLTAGPWLRIRAVTYTGASWTDRGDLDAVMGAAVGKSALLVDATALAEDLATLPGVESARVEVGLPGPARVSLVEGEAVALWLTDAAQLLVAEDGTVVGVRSRDSRPTGELADLPLVDDLRDLSHDLTIGDAIPRHELGAALELAALPPSRLGSQAGTLTVSLDATYGFVISAPQAGWQAAFGYYGLDPADTPEAIAARIASQAGGVRTLFASRPEAQVAWIDARNPGRVYFRARG